MSVSSLYASRSRPRAAAGRLMQVWHSELTLVQTCSLLKRTDASRASPESAWPGGYQSGTLPTHTRRWQKVEQQPFHIFWLMDTSIAARINTINYIIITCRIRHFMLRVAVHVYFFEMMPSTPALSCYLCPSGPTCVFADYASQIQGFTNARPYYAYVSSISTSEDNKIYKIITTS